MQFLQESLRFDIQRLPNEACFDVTVFIGNKLWSYTMTGVPESTVTLMCSVFMNFYVFSESLEDFINKVEDVECIEDVLK